MALKLKISGIKTILFGIILVLYAISFPFPQSISLVELSIIIVLFFALAKDFLHVMIFTNPTLSIAFLSLLFFPLMIGILKENNALEDIIRDVIPFLYFTIPLLFFTNRKSTENKSTLYNSLPYFLSVVGVIYACRELVELYSYSNSWGAIVPISKYYFIQSPAVLFCAVYLVLMSIIHLDKLHYTKALLLMLLATPPILGLYFMVLRAPIALIGFCAVMLLVRFYKKWIFVAVLLLMVFIVSGIYRAGSVTTLFDSFIQKQSQFGDNSKLDELSAASDLILHDDISTVFMGYGWGATWLSPAVGVKVRYAHSFITFIILKMGLIGMCFLVPFILYLIILGIGLSMKIRTPEDYAVLLSIFPVFVVNIFLESGYKTLDFGIVMLLFFLLNNLQRPIPHARP